METCGSNFYYRLQIHQIDVSNDKISSAPNLKADTAVVNVTPRHWRVTSGLRLPGALAVLVCTEKNLKTFCYSADLTPENDGEGMHRWCHFQSVAWQNKPGQETKEKLPFPW